MHHGVFDVEVEPLLVIRAGGTRVQGPGEPAAHVGGTARPHLIRETKNPFRQA